jgi:hypothetical protein
MSYVDDPSALRLEVLGGLSQPPESFLLVPAEERRLMTFDDLQTDRRPQTHATLPLYADLDFNVPEMRLGFGVVDAMSTGHMELGYCLLEADGTYNQYSGGKPVFTRARYVGQTATSSQVFIRIGDFDPAVAALAK